MLRKDGDESLLLPFWLRYGVLNPTIKAHLPKLIFASGAPLLKYNEKTVGVKSRLNLYQQWSFFPTKLCGVLVFRSVPSASASRLRVLTHTTASHTTLLTTHHLYHTIHTPSLGDIHRRFTWQAWHLATSTFVLRGRRGTYDTWLGLVTRLVPVGRP